jgi:hypothetical protein
MGTSELIRRHGLYFIIFYLKINVQDAPGRSRFIIYKSSINSIDLIVMGWMRLFVQFKEETWPTASFSAYYQAGRYAALSLISKPVLLRSHLQRLPTAEGCSETVSHFTRSRLRDASYTHDKPRTLIMLYSNFLRNPHSRELKRAVKVWITSNSMGPKPSVRTLHTNLLLCRKRHALSNPFRFQMPRYARKQNENACGRLSHQSFYQL